MKSIVFEKTDLWKKVIKCSVAYEITVVLLLIPEVLAVFTRVPYLLILSTLFFNAAGTVGNQVSELILNLMVLIPVAIFCTTVQYTLAIYNQKTAIEGSFLYENGQCVIAAVSFFVCVFAISYIRLKYPRLFLPALQSMALPFFCFTRDIHTTVFDVLLPASNIYPLLLGYGITFLVNVCLWPETAVKTSELTLGQSLEALQKVLTIAISDDHHENLADSISALQAAIDKMKRALREAKYEAVIARIAPLSYKPIASTLERLANHMYGLQLSLERLGQVAEANVVPQSTDEEGTMLLSTQNHFNTFERVYKALHPPMKTFVLHCIHTLEDIQVTLVAHKMIPPTNPRSTSQPEPYSVSIQDALHAFGRDTEIGLQSAFQHTVPVEDHLLAYTVLYVLLAYGEELVTLKAQVKSLVESRGSLRLHFPRMALTKWLSHTSQTKAHGLSDQACVDQNQHLEENHHQPHPQNARIHDRDLPSGSGAHKIGAGGVSVGASALQNTPGIHAWNRFLYRGSKVFQDAAVRYAFKFTAVCEILALAAWLPIPGINDFYNDHHGQWALLSAMTVSNYTIGATAMTCFFRMIATTLGALCGYIATLAAQRNKDPYVLAAVVFAFAVPMWYTLLGTRYPRLGFISLLTMAIVQSTNYANLTGESLIDPVWKRIVTAAAAALAILLADQLLWPVWARKLITRHLAQLLSSTGLQYARVASLMSSCAKLGTFYATESERIVTEQRILQNQYNRTVQILDLAASEPRLTKGPFPIAEYRTLVALQKKLLFWVAHVAEAQNKLTAAISDMLAPMAADRQDMAGTVHLYLYTLSNALRTRSPLPAVMPSTETVRRELHKRHLLSWQARYSDLHDTATDETLMYWNTCAAASDEVMFLQEAMGAVVARLMGQYMFGVRVPEEYARDSSIASTAVDRKPTHESRD